MQLNLTTLALIQSLNYSSSNLIPTNSNQLEAELRQKNMAQFSTIPIKALKNNYTYS